MNSIFFRIYLVSMVFFFLVLLVFTEILNRMAAESEDFFTSEAKEVVALMLPKLEAVDASAWPDLMKQFNEFQLYNEVKLIGEADLDEDFDLKALKAKGTSPMDTEEIYQQIFWLSDHDQMLMVTSPAFEEHPLSVIDQYGTYALLLLTIGFGYFLLIRYITRPIKKLTKAVNLLSTGDTDVRVREDHPKPIDQLARQFNRMADRISHQLQQQRIMIGAIPHELRTPLSHIRFALDMTKTSDDVGEIRQMIEQIDNYSDEMEQAIDETIEFIRVQDQSQLPTHLCYLRALINRALLVLDFGAVQIDHQVDPDLKLIVNEPLLTLAVKNILVNALRHAREQIRVMANVSSKGVSLLIDDDGPGIPESDRVSVFSPFSKVDDSRQKINEGIGMGLAMVAMIIHKHNGRITAEANPLGGARIHVQLPPETQASEMPQG